MTRTERQTFIGGERIECAGKGGHGEVCGNGRGWVRGSGEEKEVR